ncbi:MAG: hypothetical protein QN174_03700 [Armatimonadota bacterium]|nr:hypothetical protein [Armatimonadota bacterium]MDR7422641.1 hypothetical protein [Armatimonadota bacterium]MDR7453390.1 hypothetical protein [Armatimonadota bacterium]MDR7457209.1 hypothetical protein [Armatimonadota bacterium]MDR7496050.1 hypothetical protein [Armatimonadota bacterium]
MLGHRFVLLIEGPVPPGRYEIRIWQGAWWPWRRPYLRVPIRGRTVDEARERALAVLHHHVGLDRFRRMVEDVARRLAPGAAVELGEDARDVVIRLSGSHTLAVPLAVARDAVLDHSTPVERLRGLVAAHLEAYVRARG